MNRWTVEETDLMFSMYEWGLNGIHPESDIVLMEHDSVQKVSGIY